MNELICLIGPSGAGKSTVSKLLVEKYGYYLASTTSFLNELKDRIKNKVNYTYNTNELIAAISVTYKFGFNEFIAEQMSSFSGKTVWDSCININNLDIILRKFDKVIFLALTASYNTRITRVLERGTYPQKSFQEIRKIVNSIDQYERSLGLGDLMLLSDYTICVDGIDNLKNSIDVFINTCTPSSIEEKISMINYNFQISAFDNINVSPLLEYLNK